MARSRAELHETLTELVPSGTSVYFQAPTTMSHPCIMYEPGIRNEVNFADNFKYMFKKGYTIMVIDRDPDSLIPDLIEGLPYSRYDRSYRTNGLNHWIYQLYF